MSIAEQYTNEISQGLQYLPTWLPLRSLSLGDVGMIKDNMFERETDLQALNIPFSTSTSRPAGSMRYNSDDGVSMFFKASGSAPAIGSALTSADAGVVVKFTRANAVVFEASGCRIESISDLAKVGDQIIRRYQAGNWDKNLCVITEVVKSDSATILVSSGNTAGMELKAGGKLDAAGLSLADVNAGFQIASTAGMGLEIVGEQNLSPLFKAWRVKSGLFRTSWDKYRMSRDGFEDKENLEEDVPIFSPVSVRDLWPN